MSYPPGGYPPQPFPPQGGYPQQGGYPLQGGHYPQQGGYYPPGFPPPRKKTPVGVIVGVVAAVALLVFGAGGWFVWSFAEHARKTSQAKSSATSSVVGTGVLPPNIDPTTTSTTASRRGSSAYQIGDCLSITPSSDQLGSCGDNSGPYQILKSVPEKSGCSEYYGSIRLQGETDYLCVDPNFVVGACYNVPEAESSEWITGATCGAIGAYVVRTAKKGTSDKSVCGSSDADTIYTIDSIPEVVCLKRF
ncbi:hypothetical protein [Segniliparus rugosus]|uniref:Uncharacterized protein n=1 Tax=Segniliparus rugosus (strain ATCC BAA-974 / DSM 45345 / CCUG 50838 / CIP 108380 / JCM 13579 / CDC 945) TaxID=679197 RepID=E5XNX5_SEGRC|nr:hypothetical protein [Segniliparus rugosus]EFV13944.1 hypothetical protein HMPREF9336_01196 [Segniliparus rugosus ATCC BAA-974]